MADRKLLKLILALSDKTERKLISWVETNEPGKFSASFSNYSVLLYRSDSENNDVVFVIQNKDGHIVEEVTDTSFSTNDLSDGPYIFFSNFYSSVRRNAMGIDTALDSILEELSTPDDEVEVELL